MKLTELLHRIDALEKRVKSLEGLKPQTKKETKDK